MNGSVYIDSDVIVSSKRKIETNHKDSKDFLQMVLKNNLPDITFFTCRFTGVEVASAMIRRTSSKDRAYSLLYKMGDPWSEKIFLLPKNSSERITWKKLITDLIETTIEYKTNAGDTLHAYFIVNYKMDYFVTWNKKHFLRLKKKIKGLDVLTPIEFTAKLKSDAARQRQRGLTYIWRKRVHPVRIAMKGRK